MPRLLVIHTGGTIGCHPGPDGLAPFPKGEFGPVLRKAITDAAHQDDFDFFEMDRLIDSSQAYLDDWAKIGRIIADRYQDYDGFVVLHGTDTMDHAAANLSFMLENLGKPVVLTGSQKPLIAPHTDAVRNVGNALKIAADGKIREVSLCFCNTLLRGVRALKFSAESFDAFISPNLPPLASFTDQGIVYNPDILPPDITGEFNFLPYEDTLFSIIDTKPGKHGHHLHLARDLKQAERILYIRGFGNGNIPQSNETEGALSLQKNANAVIIVGSQCPQVNVDFRYAAGNWTTAFGAIPAYDMTDATVIAKINYLAQKVGYRPYASTGSHGVMPSETGQGADEIRYWMQRDLRGEGTFPADMPKPEAVKSLTFTCV